MDSWATGSGRHRRPHASPRRRDRGPLRYALALHGNTGTDDFGLRGGYPWRRDTKTAEAATVIELIHLLRLDDLHPSFSHWLDFESTPAALAEMCTGWQIRASIVIAR